MPPKAAVTNKRPPKVIDPLEYQRRREDLLPIDASLASKFSTKLEGTYILYRLSHHYNVHIIII